MGKAAPMEIDITSDVESDTNRRPNLRCYLNFSHVIGLD